jgi:Glycosyltransferase 61
MGLPLRSLWRRVRFGLVRSAGPVLRPFVSRVDPRRTPLPQQVQLRPARTVQWNLERLSYIGPEPFWRKATVLHLDASFQVELEHAEVIGPGVVLTREGRVVLESTLFQEEYLRRSHAEHLIVGRHLLRPEVYPMAVPIANFLDASYFHWTLEALGRLALVEDLLVKQPWGVLVDHASPKYVKETLRFFFGLGPERILASPARRCRLQRCLLVSNPHSRDVANGKVEVHAPEHIQWLNRNGHARIGGVRGHRHNIVISRRMQRGRRILNEHAISERYPQLEFRFVTLETLSLAEQVELFAHANIIIGVHGAGFTNLVYATDAAVIEFYPTRLQEKNTAYFVQIAAQLGLPHLLIHFEGVGVAPHWDLTLGPTEFEHMDRFLRAQGKI